MSWTTKAGRFLKFLWKSGTMGVVNEEALMASVETTLESLKPSFPELACTENAIVSSRPHPTPKADGRIDPMHANFIITDATNKPVVRAHAYVEPLGGRYVWFSEKEYNGGKEAKQYFPLNPAKKKPEDAKDGTDHGKWDDKSDNGQGRSNSKG